MDYSNTSDISFAPKKKKIVNDQMGEGGRQGSSWRDWKAPLLKSVMWGTASREWQRAACHQFSTKARLAEALKHYRPTPLKAPVEAPITAPVALKRPVLGWATAPRQSKSSDSATSSMSRILSFLHPRHALWQQFPDSLNIVALPPWKADWLMRMTNYSAKSSRTPCRRWLQESSWVMATAASSA